MNSFNHRVQISGFVAEDLVTQALLSTLRDFALLDGSSQRLKHLLLTGERGVGKELLAKAIHSWSGRSKKIFRAVNFGAISKDLAAAEVFGAKKGASTGADRDRRVTFRRLTEALCFWMSWTRRAILCRL